MLVPKKHRSVIVALVLIILSLVILSFNIRQPGDVGFFRKIIVETAAPVEHGIGMMVGGIADVWKRYIFLVGLEEENRLLKRKVDILTSEIVNHREVYLEGLRLKEHLKLREKTDLPMVTARVINREGTSVFKSILINKGTTDGIEVGMPVVTAEGVVGRIIEVSWNVSRVLLVIDFNSNADALVEGGRAHGILQGGGASSCILKYIERSEEVKIGDVVLTSGLGGVFPKGLLLGTVLNVNRKDAGLFQRIEVVPAVHFSRLEEVSVLQLKGSGS